MEKKLKKLEVLSIDINKNKDLFYSARSGNSTGLVDAITQGADLNCQSQTGSTPLNVAVKQGHLHIVEKLLQVNADMEIPDKEGLVPLHKACVNGNLKVAEALISEGCIHQPTDKLGNTPLHYAAINGDIQLGKLLLDNGHRLICFNEAGDSPLDISNQYGKEDFYKCATMSQQTDKNVMLIKAVYGADIAKLTDLRKSAGEIDLATVNVVQKIALKKNDGTVNKLLGLIVKKFRENKLECSIEEMLSDIASPRNSEDSLLATLRKLYSNIQFCDEKRFQDILKVVLLSMDVQINNISINSAGLLIFDFILYNLSSTHLLRDDIKSQIIETTLDILKRHHSYTDVVTYASRIFDKFTGSEMFSKYEVITSIIMTVFRASTTELEFKECRRSSLILLNHMSSKAGSDLKVIMADTGLIKMLLMLTKEKLNRYDNELDLVWDILTGLTDGIPVNCKTVLTEKGELYASMCLQAYPSNSNLMNSILICLSNISECPELRKELMKPAIMGASYALLESNQADYKVSFVAAYLLCFMASDGPEVWSIELPTRYQFLKRLSEVIERWSLETVYQVSASTFKTDLQILQDSSTPEIQHWVLWNLVWYTKQNAEKYCTLLEEEGGLPILQKILDNTSHNTKLKELASIVIKCCQDSRNMLIA